MDELDTWSGRGAGTTGRLGPSDASVDRVVDLLSVHHDQAASHKRPLSVYLAGALLILVVLLVYAAARLFASLGGLGTSLSH